MIIRQKSQSISRCSEARADRLGTPGGAMRFLRGAQIFKLSPIRPVTSLGQQGWRRVFWKGPKFFQLCPTVFNYAQQIFSRFFQRKILQGRHRTTSPLVMGLCPMALKPLNWSNRWIEALEMNVRLLLLWLATLRIRMGVRRRGKAGICQFRLMI